MNQRRPQQPSVLGLGVDHTVSFGKLESDYKILAYTINQISTRLDIGDAIPTEEVNQIANNLSTMYSQVTVDTLLLPYFQAIAASMDEENKALYAHVLKLNEFPPMLRHLGDRITAIRLSKARANPVSLSTPTPVATSSIFPSMKKISVINDASLSTRDSQNNKCGCTKSAYNCSSRNCGCHKGKGSCTPACACHAKGCHNPNGTGL